MKAGRLSKVVRAVGIEKEWQKNGTVTRETKERHSLRKIKRASL